MHTTANKEIDADDNTTDSQQVMTQFVYSFIHSSYLMTTLLDTEQDPMCPLCQEEYDTSLHLLGRCSALVENEENSLENKLVNLSNTTNIIT